MFGLEFLFPAALMALPLAALPLILHLRNRRKSPVVQFPTLHFIKSSLQQTAARRKVHRWLLLAIRMLLLALLIWAVSQPARTLASRFFTSAEQSMAVIVVDTSWSMHYERNQQPLLEEAQQAVQQLLRNELKDASVLLITTEGGETGVFRPSAELLGSWTPLQPAKTTIPISERMLAAMELLRQSPATQKLLVVLSDFQSRDFPRPLAQVPEDLRLVAIDLRPDAARSSGVQRISLSPAQPIAGLKVTAEVELSGPPGDVRPVSLAAATLDGKELLQLPPAMASFDDFGQATARFELQPAPDRWQILTASIQGEDPMPWDDRRQLVIELPPQQRVIVLDAAPSTDRASRLVTLALDPEEGNLANWPLRVETGRAIAGQNAAVVLLEQMPDEATVRAWRNMVNSGGTLILMLKPGIEAAWRNHPAAGALEQLVPGEPYAVADQQLLRFAPAAGARQDPSASGLVDAPGALDTLRSSRLVHMPIDNPPSTRMLIASIAGDRRPAMDRDGLLYVRKVGAGRVFTWACIPDGLSTNLGTHPMFLPLLVNQCLRPLDASLAANLEIGEAIAWSHSRQVPEMEIHTPSGEAFRVPVTDGKATFSGASAPGIYTWHVPGQQGLRGVANVSPPGSEAQASYRPAETLLPTGPNVLVARSLQEMQTRIAEITQPQPKWTMPLALAILLLCVESLVSTRHSR